MEFLKSIPQAFFDFVARILPGAVALAVIEWTVPGSWKRALDVVSAGTLNSDNAFSFVTLLAVGASYGLGQLLAPAGKVVDKTTQAIVRRIRLLTRSGEEWPLSTQEDWRKYDRLRVNAPSAGGLAVRIRAEYSMYNILAATFFLGAAVGVYTAAPIVNRAAFTALGFVMAWRGWDVQKMFVLSVRKLHEAAFESAAVRSTS